MATRPPQAGGRQSESSRWIRASGCPQPLLWDYPFAPNFSLIQRHESSRPPRPQTSSLTLALFGAQVEEQSTSIFLFIIGT